MNEIRVRSIVEGKAAGEILFSSQPIAFLQGVDVEGGFVSDKKHEIYLKPFEDKILVFPNAVGSSVGAYVIYRLKKNGKAPRAIINQKADMIIASGCAISEIPLFDLVDGKISELREISKVRVDEKKLVLVEY